MNKWTNSEKKMLCYSQQNQLTVNQDTKNKTFFYWLKVGLNLKLKMITCYGNTHNDVLDVIRVFRSTYVFSDIF